MFVNFLTSLVLECMSRWEGHQSKSEQVYSSARFMFILEYINMAVLIQLVYFNWLPESLSLKFVKQ